MLEFSTAPSVANETAAENPATKASRKLKSTAACPIDDTIESPPKNLPAVKAVVAISPYPVANAATPRAKLKADVVPLS